MFLWPVTVLAMSLVHWVRCSISLNSSPFCVEPLWFSHWDNSSSGKALKYRLKKIKEVYFLRGSPSSPAPCLAKS